MYGISTDVKVDIESTRHPRCIGYSRYYRTVAPYLLFQLDRIVGLGYLLFSTYTAYAANNNTDMMQDETKEVAMLKNGSLSATGMTNASDEGHMDGLADLSFHPSYPYFSLYCSTKRLDLIRHYRQHGEQRSFGTSAGRIRQSRSCHPPLSRHSASIPALPLDLYPSVHTSHPVPTAEQRPRSRVSYSFLIPRGIDSSPPIPVPRSEAAPGYSLAGAATSRAYYCPPAPKSVINSFHGQHTARLTSLCMCGSG